MMPGAGRIKVCEILYFIRFEFLCLTVWSVYSFYCIDKATEDVEVAFNNLSFLAGLAGNELAAADLFLDSILKSESKRLCSTISRKGHPQAAGKTFSRPFLHATLPSPPLIDHTLLTVRMSGTSQGMTGLSASIIMPAPPSKPPVLCDLDESL